MSIANETPKKLQYKGVLEYIIATINSLGEPNI